MSPIARSLPDAARAGPGFRKYGHLRTGNALDARAERLGAISFVSLKGPWNDGADDIYDWATGELL